MLSALCIALRILIHRKQSFPPTFPDSVVHTFLRGIYRKCPYLMSLTPPPIVAKSKKCSTNIKIHKKSLIYNISKITTKLVLCKKIHVLYSVYFSNLPENSNGHHFSTDATSNVLLAPVQLTGRKLFPATCSASNTLLVAQFTVTDQHSRRVFATLSPHVSQFDN